MKDFLAPFLTSISAAALAALCVLPQTYSYTPFWLFAIGAHIADTLFHEMGHTLFSWCFGQPAIPMIFTVFGADQAGGMTKPLCDRSWVLQGVALVVLGYACYRLWREESNWRVPTALLSFVVLSAAFTRYYLVVILYAGHGGAVLGGGWLLYRGLLHSGGRKWIDRWLNAFVGLFMIGHNFYFSYSLAFDAGARADYTDHVAFGISDNDFQAIADHMWRWSVKGIAEFTMGYCCVVLIASMVLALWRRQEYVEVE